MERRQAAAAARSRRRIRQDDPRRARPDARGRQLLAAAAQLPALAAVAGARDPLGLDGERSAGHGADGRHSDRPHRRADRAPASISSGSRAPVSRSSSRRCSATASSTPTCTPATSSSASIRATTASTSRSTSASWARCRSSDKNYLAQNFLAFFRRDYHRVATTHIESGWVPANTRVDELESEIRVVCEPIFDRPLKEISLGKVLVQLFRASRRFNVEIQPQLVLLQKTLLNVEGLGRQLDPDLDLWVTAKPFLERWMEDQIGFRALERRLFAEARVARAACCPSCRACCTRSCSAPPPASDTALMRSRGAAVAQPLARVSRCCCDRDRAARRRGSSDAALLQRRSTRSLADRATADAESSRWRCSTSKASRGGSATSPPSTT